MNATLVPTVTVHLPTPLRSLVGGASEVEVAGATAGDVLCRLERDYPRLAGWVLDEQGRLRQHVHVFVNAERASLDSPVRPADQIHVVQAISGGAPGRVEVLAGTRKGLFVLRGPRGGGLEVAARLFAGLPVEYAVRDPRTGRTFASVTHWQFGPRLFWTEDSLAPEDDWRQAQGPVFPEETGAALERIWVVQPGEEEGVLWAGAAPAALFRSGDGGLSWELVRALWDEPSRPRWEPGAGGLCLHSISPWPGEPGRLALGISAAGVWLTEDGGASWRRSVAGLVPRYVPEEARATTFSYCVHNLHRVACEPSTLYMQFHGGVYRSDDAGETWNDVGHPGTGLPSDFGFPLVSDPRDPGRAWVIPLASDGDRVTPEGRLRVYETRDRGATWRPFADGLPQRDCYLTILRQAFCHDGGDPLGLYFGATSGDLFASADAGATWRAATERLPPIHSVRCSLL